MNKIKSVGIIGLGNVGITLSKYILNEIEHNLELSWLCSKHFKDIKIFPQTTIYNDIKEIKIVPDAILICVKDEMIFDICKNLCEHFKENLKEKYIIHTAGAYRVNLLDECEKYGGIPVAAHPFQTFASQEINCLQCIDWGIEIKDNSIEEIITDFIEKLAGKPHFLSKEVCEQKELYHIMGVATSNFMTATIKYGAMVSQKLNIKNGDFLSAIIMQTAMNCIDALQENNYDIPITGPAIRKDEITINKHLEALEKYPDLKQIYIDFTKILKELY